MKGSVGGGYTEPRACVIKTYQLRDLSRREVRIVVEAHDDAGLLTRIELGRDAAAELATLIIGTEWKVAQ